ncbi:PREDICTED: uncharacterized protein LOC104591372 [Nelumbo nucifera]|uniref:Uncharacterized protein LOC104591372 n=1 Tax=Nelumbo nucifera TaxID=4432 RepID=A0A1U7ZKU4_NELNU|nr:PREDICTED: uncharacterized protein LOC104591372 [Nelumbo nucifera]
MRHGWNNTTSPATNNPHSANFVAHDKNKNNWNSKNTNRRGGSAPSNGRGHSSGRNHGDYPNQYNGGRNNGGGCWKGNFSQIIYYVCNKPSHDAFTCRRHYDLSYQGEQQTPPDTVAYHTSVGNEVDPMWYLDSGVTHHLTPDVDNLQNRSEYMGLDQVAIGNGSGLQILHSRSSSLTHNNHTFALNSIYHVPHITKNLLSVSKFTKDNDIYLEFHRDFFLVNDYTGRVLIRGTNRDGLYQFPRGTQVNNKAIAFVGECTTFSGWHQ